MNLAIIKILNVINKESLWSINWLLVSFHRIYVCAYIEKLRSINKSPLLFKVNCCCQNKTQKQLMSYLWMKLLLRSRMTIFTKISVFTHSRLEPVVALLHIGARRRPVLEQARVPALVARIVKLRTRKALAAEARRPPTLLRLVVGQDIAGFVPFGVFVEQTLLFEGRRQAQRFFVHEVGAVGAGRALLLVRTLITMAGTKIRCWLIFLKT